jgi:hypothetical protein
VSTLLPLLSPEINTANGNFEIKTGLITMVLASPFCGKPNEDATAHLQQFMELCSYKWPNSPQHGGPPEST